MPRYLAIQEYLALVNIPHLTADQCAPLELPITPAEIELTVKSLPNGKSPRPEGFTKMYCKAFLSLLVNPICSYFNFIAEGNTIPPEALLAHISVLSKGGKNSTVPQSYPTISLLNVDVKILTKILALCPYHST